MSNISLNSDLVLGIYMGKFFVVLAMRAEATLSHFYAILSWKNSHISLGRAQIKEQFFICYLKKTKQINLQTF